MKKVGVFVGEHGHWGFFREIFADLEQHYQTEVFQEKTYNLPLLYGRFNRWAYSGQIRSMLKHNDVCFFEWASELLKEASLLEKQCPIVTRMHSYEVHVWAPQIEWAHVDRIIFVSEYIRQKFLESHPEQAAKSSVIYNGVDLERFQPNYARDFTFSIGMLCNFHPVKRIYEMVFTVAELKRQGYHPHLHIAGGKWPGGHLDGYYIAIERVIEKLNLQDTVTLHGPIKDPQRWLREIDIVVSNSYWEGQSVALLEGMASGCYALSHFWDGVEDVLPAEQIYSHDVELQEKLIAYAEHSAAEKRQLQMRMRDLTCQKFDIRQTAKAIRALLEEVTHQNSLPFVMRRQVTA